jgi:hypothetical protein
MKDWLKGLILMIIGNVLYEVIPNWVTEYLLSQPNPLYSIGSFLSGLPSLQDILSGESAFSIGILGFLLIIYGLYLFVRDLYTKS